MARTFLYDDRIENYALLKALTPIMISGNNEDIEITVIDNQILIIVNGVLLFEYYAFDGKPTIDIKIQK